MKKLEKKLRIDRETLRRLNPQEVSTADLAKAQGGLAQVDRYWTGCLSDCTQC